MNRIVHPPDALVHHFLERSADVFPDKDAVFHKGRWHTFRELECQANAMALRLLALGLARGDRVAHAAEQFPGVHHLLLWRHQGRRDRGAAEHGPPGREPAVDPGVQRQPVPGHVGWLPGQTGRPAGSPGRHGRHHLLRCFRDPPVAALQPASRPGGGRRRDPRRRHRGAAAGADHRRRRGVHRVHLRQHRQAPRRDAEAFQHPDQHPVHRLLPALDGSRPGDGRAAVLLHLRQVPAQHPFLRGWIGGDRQPVRLSQHGAEDHARNRLHGLLRRALDVRHPAPPVGGPRLQVPRAAVPHPGGRGHGAGPPAGGAAGLSAGGAVRHVRRDRGLGPPQLPGSRGPAAQVGVHRQGHPQRGALRRRRGGPGAAAGAGRGARRPRLQHHGGILERSRRPPRRSCTTGCTSPRTSGGWTRRASSTWSAGRRR